MNLQAALNWRMPKRPWEMKIDKVKPMADAA
jgi:hypothetical protein